MGTGKRIHIVIEGKANTVLIYAILCAFLEFFQLTKWDGINSLALANGGRPGWVLEQSAGSLRFMDRLKTGHHRMNL